MESSIIVSIFRKPTTTDCIIPRDPNSVSKKLVAIKYSLMEYICVCVCVCVSKRHQKKKEILIVEGALRHNQYSTTTININNSDKMTKNREKGKEDKHEDKRQEKI
jgi:hypothetical protein